MSIKSQLKVLVVDDMSTSRHLTMAALGEIVIVNASWEVSGRDAMASLSKNPVHLIISDYNMPNGSGIDLLRAVRESPSIANTGFIIVTGSPDERIMQAGTVLKLNNFIKKPFSTQQLKKCIERVVGPL